MLFSVRLALGGAYCVSSAWYCRSVVQNLRPGLARLAAVVPLVACDFCLPRLFDPATEGPALLIYALILTFLHSFKVCPTEGWCLPPLLHILHLLLIFCLDHRDLIST